MPSWRNCKSYPTILAKGFYDDVHARALVETGEQYAVYIHRGRHAKDTCYRVSEADSTIRYSDEIGLWIPAGRYTQAWIKPETGETLETQIIDHTGPLLELKSPEYSLDIALRILKI